MSTGLKKPAALTSSSSASLASTSSPGTVGLAPQATAAAAVAAAVAAAAANSGGGQAVDGLSQPTQRVHSAVLRYLGRRGYERSIRESYRKFFQPPKSAISQSKQAMALQEIIKKETSSDNRIAFSSHVASPVVVEQQYSNFKVWISESPDSYKPELAQLLYPVFTHLYLDLVASGNKVLSSKFLKRHQATFMGNAEFANFIRILGNVTGPDNLSNDDVISTYSHSRYSVTLSHRTFHYLRRYLQQERHPPVLLQILHSKVDLKLADPMGSCSKVEAVDRLKNDQQSPHPADEQLKQSNHAPQKKSSLDVDRLHDTIRSMRNMCPTPLPSVCLYMLNSDASTVSSTRICHDSQQLAAGSEDSLIRVWNLYPKSDDDDQEEDSHDSDGDVDQNDDDSTTNDEYAGAVYKRQHRGGCKRQRQSEDDEVNSVSVIRLGCDWHSPLSSGGGIRHARAAAHRTLRGHSGPVYGLAFVPETPYLVSCSEDTTLRVWDKTSGVNKAILSGHSYPVWCTDIDRVGINVATGSMDRTAKLWHLEFTFPLRIYAGHERDVDVVKFHPNCNYLATAGADKTIRLWSHADAKMVRVFHGHLGGIYSLAFSPDGKFLASGGEDRRVRLWDLATSKLLKELRGHTDTVYSLAWSSDSSLLLSGGLDSSLKIWNVYESAIGSSNDRGTNDPGMPAELMASYETSCYNLVDLCFSYHNTLLATGISRSSAIVSPTSGMSSLQQLNGTLFT